MARVVRDEYGMMTLDVQGYAHRGPEFSRRYTQLEGMSQGQSGWRREGTGFASVYPVHSWAHRKIVDRLVEIERVRGGSASSRPSITHDSSPVYGEWTSDDWITWHRAMAKRDGEAAADARWRDAWLDGLSRTFAKRANIKGTVLAFDVQVSELPASEEFKAYVAARPTLHSAVYLGTTTTATTNAHRAANPHTMPPEQVMVGAVPDPNAQPPPSSSSNMRIGKLAGLAALGGAIYLWWKHRANPRVEQSWRERDRGGAGGGGYGGDYDDGGY